MTHRNLYSEGETTGVREESEETPLVSPSLYRFRCVIPSYERVEVGPAQVMGVSGRTRRSPAPTPHPILTRYLRPHMRGKPRLSRDILRTTSDVVQEGRN